MVVVLFRLPVVERSSSSISDFGDAPDAGAKAGVVGFADLTPLSCEDARIWGVTVAPVAHVADVSGNVSSRASSRRCTFGA